MRMVWSRHLVAMAAYAVAYCAADVAINLFAFSDGWTLMWPLNGITVALMIVQPRSSWWSMLLGIEIGTAIGECLDGQPFGFEIVQRLCSASEVLMSAWLLPPFKTLEGWLQHPRLSQRFLAALLLGPGLSGLLAATAFLRFEGVPFLIAFNNWATADALGMAATLPLALSVSSPQMRALFEPKELPRTFGVLLVSLLVGTLIFAVDRYPLGWVLYPTLLFTELQLGFAGASIAVVGILFISIYLTTTGHGLFGHWPAERSIQRDLAFQIFFGFQLVALIPASVVLFERRRMAEELRETNARLSALASLDALTGIANRRAFDERFEREWRRAVLLHAPIALVMIDLDHFKEFNDTYGHPAGDKCLRAVADALALQLRYPEACVARFGGEEFAVLLSDTDLGGASGVAERIRGAIHGLGIEHAGSDTGRVTVSIGFAAIVPRESDGRDSLAQLADAALYRAKRLGRDRVEMIGTEDALEAATARVGNSTRLRLLSMMARRP